MVNYVFAGAAAAADASWHRGFQKYFFFSSQAAVIGRCILHMFMYLM
jgi:hypothetical protein